VRTLTLARHFAPTKIQSENSNLILSKSVGMEDSTRSKTRLFLSFRWISQDKSSVKEREAFRGVFRRMVMIVHQSIDDEERGQCVGCRLGSPSQVAISARGQRMMAITVGDTVHMCGQTIHFPFSVSIYFLSCFSYILDFSAWLIKALQLDAATSYTQ
jgi:hypothetical protein